MGDGGPPAGDRGDGPGVEPEALGPAVSAGHRAVVDDDAIGFEPDDGPGHRLDVADALVGRVVHPGGVAEQVVDPGALLRASTWGPSSWP